MYARINAGELTPLIVSSRTVRIPIEQLTADSHIQPQPIKDGSLPEISEERKIRRLKKKIDEQNEEITGLKRTVKDRDAEIKTLNKSIAKANAEIQSLHGKIDRLSEDNSDKKESAEAKTDDNGYRTRKVASTVIQKCSHQNSLLTERSIPCQTWQKL